MVINFLYIIFFTALFIQFIYYFRYFLPLSKFTSKKINSAQPKVSVVICAHNEEINLKKNLESILNQKYPDFEVIVVDDRSTDKTSEIVKSVENDKINLIRIDEVEKDKSPKKNALTKGFEIAKGKFVLLTDADCKPNSDQWITKMVEKASSSTTIVLGYSPYQQKKGWLNKLIQFDTFFTAIQYLSFALKGEAYMGVGRNLLIRKKAFFDVNGFEGFEYVLAGDDDIIVQKIARKDNVEICIDEESYMISKPETTWKNWVSQKRRHLSVGVNYKKSNIFKIGLFQQSFVWLYLTFFTFTCINEVHLSFIYSMLAIILTKNYIINLKLKKGLNVKVSLYLLPVLELLYFFTFLLVGISVLIRNKHTWL